MCILRDTYNQISGPVGVAKVVQILSPQYGWVTEITPKMMVFPSNASGLYQMSMVHRGAVFWLGKQAIQFYTNRRPFLAADDYGINFTSQFQEEMGQILGKKFIELNKDPLTEMTPQSEANRLKTTAEKKGAGTSYAYADALVKTSVADTFGDQYESNNESEKINSSTVDLGTTLLAIPFGVFGIAASFVAGSVFDGFINWSKYRQPIMFYPVARYGQPWYAALDGFKNNSRIDSIKGSVYEGIDRVKFYKDQVLSIFDHYKGE